MCTLASVANGGYWQPHILQLAADVVMDCAYSKSDSKSSCQLLDGNGRGNKPKSREQAMSVPLHLAWECAGRSSQSKTAAGIDVAGQCRVSLIFS